MYVFTVRINTLRIIFIIVIFEDLKYYQTNISNVFTELILIKEIYIILLKNIHVLYNKAIRLRRSLY